MSEQDDRNALGEKWDPKTLAPSNCQRCKVETGMLFTEHGCWAHTSGVGPHVWADGTTSCSKVQRGAACTTCANATMPRTGRLTGFQAPPHTATHPRALVTTGFEQPIALPTVKAFYRVVDYLGPASSWEPALALVIRGDGPLLQFVNGNVVVFMTGEELIVWAREYALYLIGLEPRA